MAQYYVIRNKNTGLYFRGKGVNRWGKHYNQASIYRVKAMAEHTIKEVSWRGEQAEIVPIQIIETAADVVPKSEVDKAMQKGYELGKREVAREIFAELYEIKEDHLLGDIDDRRLYRLIAELKKKYTEDQT